MQNNHLNMHEEPASLGSIDIGLLCLLLTLLCLGLLAVLSASGPYSQKHFHGDSYHLFYRQLIYMAIGGVCIIFFSLVPRKFINGLHYWAIGIIFILLLLCLIIGPKINGSHRWIDFHFIMLQPMEFARIAVVLYIAYYLGNKQKTKNQFMMGVAPPLIVTGTFIILLLLQPDLGGAVLLAMILVFMLSVGGIPFKHIGFVLCPIIIGGVFLIFSAPYRLARWLAFLHPFEDFKGIGWQLSQSLLALGSGGFFGVGIGGSIQKNGFLPEAHNDFIMAVVGEEIGFIGLTFIMAVFALFFIRCYHIIMKQKVLRDKLCAFGLTIAIAQSVILSMAVVLGMVPPKGIAMPFFSYGGSSLLANMICAGLLLNYSRTIQE